MHKRIRKNTRVTFICPFCKKDIIASKKTEVLYRSSWVDGCSDCFLLSIEKSTSMHFQTRIIQDLI